MPHDEPTSITRRRLLELAAMGSAASVIAALRIDAPRVAMAQAASEEEAEASPSPDLEAEADFDASPLPDVEAQVSRRRVLYRNTAIADGRRPGLRRGVSVLVSAGRIAWIRPADSEEDLGRRSNLRIIEAAGATIVPGMVDAHSHLTLPGGANWLDRVNDPPARMLRVAEDNGKLAMQAGIRWFRDVGSPTVRDPEDGRRRALALGVRDRWAGRRDRPKVRSAGTWLAPPGVLRRGIAIEVHNADQLLAAARRQMAQGADLVKLYVQSPDPDVSPWSADEIRLVVDAVHARGGQATAHVQRVGPARAAVNGGVDALEHGFRLDADVARQMKRRGTFLVSTLTVPRSFLAIGRAARGTPFSSRAGRRSARALLEDAEASVRIARRAGVRIAAGTDFGGGSSRANQLAWEVESLVAAGLQPWEALGAATWRGGQLLDEPEAGVIREGGPADFFLVHGDPLSTPRALTRIWRHA
ncbi:MAG: amidohydrolase family protein [Chloroflexota bacterium]